MIELRKNSYKVPGGKKIFDDFSLKIPDGKFVVITGPNGGGKSTLAKLLIGLNKPNSGEIIWDGRNITTMSVTDRAKAGMAFSFQQPVKIKGITVKDLLEISGGEIKRIEIASVLARKAKFTIFDEPEAGIDLWSFNDLTSVFKKMRKDNPENTLIIISHQERIIKLADEVIILENGKVKKTGTPNEVMGDIL